MIEKHNQTDSALTVTVIVPAHRGDRALRHCLQSIAALSPPPAACIVVVDGSNAAALTTARSYGVHVLATPTPRGPAYARNLGASVAHTDLLFFVDSDVTVPPDAIVQVVQAFDSDPSLAALIGSYDDAPDAPSFLSQYKNLLHHYTHQTGREEASTFWGACGAIKRNIFAQLDGFDAERYQQPSIEDIELGYRLIAVGERIRLEKALQVKHLKQWTALSLVRTDFFQRALPWTELLVQGGEMRNDLNLQRSSRLSVVCVYGLLTALVATLRWPRVGVLAGAFAGALLALNAAVYRFFWHKRGWWFAVRVVPWHWLYYVYSGAAFAMGSLRFHIARLSLKGKGS